MLGPIFLLSLFFVSVALASEAQPATNWGRGLNGDGESHFTGPSGIPPKSWTDWTQSSSIFTTATVATTTTKSTIITTTTSMMSTSSTTTITTSRSDSTTSGSDSTTSRSDSTTSRSDSTTSRSDSTTSEIFASSTISKTSSAGIATASSAIPSTALSSSPSTAISPNTSSRPECTPKVGAPGNSTRPISGHQSRPSDHYSWDHWRPAATTETCVESTITMASSVDSTVDVQQSSTISVPEQALPSAPTSVDAVASTSIEESHGEMPTTSTFSLVSTPGPVPSSSIGIQPFLGGASFQACAEWSTVLATGLLWAAVAW